MIINGFTIFDIKMEIKCLYDEDFRRYFASAFKQKVCRPNAAGRSRRDKIEKQRPGGLGYVNSVFKNCK